MAAAQRPQRSLGVGMAGQLAGEVLGEDRHADRLHELLGPIGHAIEIARHQHAGVARQSGGAQGDGGILVVHVDESCAPDHVGRQLAIANVQPLVARPQDDALAAGLVDQDHRVAVGRIANHGVVQIDLPRRQLLADAAAVVVAAGDADVLRRQTEAGAGGQSGRHLPAAAHDLLADAHLGELAVGLRRRRQQRDEVDGVGADANDVPARRRGGARRHRAAVYVGARARPHHRRAPAGGGHGRAAGSAEALRCWKTVADRVISWRPCPARIC